MSRLVLVAALAGLVLAAAPAAAQDLHPSRRPSPIGIAKAFIGDTYLKVTYGRPYMRGREIFGPAGGEEEYLVPFGEIWRTGANEATEITVTDPVRVMGQRLEAGTYSIFTVPGPSSWEVRFHSGLGMDGLGRMAQGGFTQTYDPARDVLVVQAPVATLDEPVDQFTISFEDTADGTDMVLRWETTEVRVPITPAAQ